MFVALASVPARAARVVSLNLCTDELLVELAPEQVAAVSPLARDPALSMVARQAASLPWVRPDAEAVLRLNPDLVLAGEYGAQAVLAVLRQDGVRVVQVAEPSDFPGVAKEITAVAGALGIKPRGAAMIDAMWAALAAVHKRPAARAIFWQARGYSAAPGSFDDTVLRDAGLTDVGNGRVIGVEKMVTHPPDLLVVEAAPAYPSLSTDVLHNPALSGVTHVSVPPALLTCAGPWSVKAVKLLAG